MSNVQKAKTPLWWSRKSYLRADRLYSAYSVGLLSLVANASIASSLNRLDEQANQIQDDQALCRGPFHVFQYREASTFILPNTPTDLLDLGDMGCYSAGDPVRRIEIEELLALDHTLFPGISPGLASRAPTPIAFPCWQKSPPDLADFSLSLAKELLDHYWQTMIAFFTLARVRSSSPWETIHIPSLFTTMGEIELSGNSTNAKVSLVFAILAINAFSLDGRFGSTRPATKNWHALGELYRSRATKRLKCSLQNLSSGRSKTEKYEDILMALLSMVTICVVSGKMRNSAHYLRDIEGITKLYGLQKATHSIKVRLLHGIYLYLRVLTERALLRYSSSRPSLRWNQLLGLSSPLPDSHAPRPGLISGQQPGESALEQIYSIPQSLFELIFQTTQMAGEMQNSQNSGREQVNYYDLFPVKVKELENRVCGWEHQAHDGPFRPSCSTVGPQRERFPYHLVQAVYKALIIYFYRCVRNVHAATLQPYVQQIIQHPHENDKQKEILSDRSSNTCWSGFVAGCEALDPDLRAKYAKWLEQSSQSTGIQMFSVALGAAQKVWHAQSLPGMQNVPWTRVLRRSLS
ncbi:fungal specific transcription factor domain-containing protein [Aspergillus ibericus CBS 121593]|uniref:Transcription factor domain-containing protein n=1 Tax=Aspergillus ibericus CBS 121593 TaxID=1448316 RepID=A0A395H5P7_9EURO|nr:hypothetical protein BO80DRAFT_470902 [Aspergillus ibericus CBS 121593]RAL03202.1 hypothetical protein BO80DRAFT_470902 [Aspergillus ibericus CBS 121593]